MDQDTLHWLRSEPGQALLAELAASDLADHTVLPTITHLRKRYPADLARAAVEQTLLRRRAVGRMPHAERLFFTREALEQATSAVVARWRAGRLAAAASHVADAGCGIGGDTLALALAGCHVTAIERDALRLALAQANAEVLGVAQHVTWMQADALQLLVQPLPSVSALFCDPGRRAGGRRRFSVAQYEPPLAQVLHWRSHTPVLTVKLAPGVDRDELTALGIGTYDELEFVSLDGELKEAVLWCGPLAEVPRRATLLRQDAGAAQAEVLMGDASEAAPPLCEPDRFLYEPDPAVIRAGLVARLAQQIGAAQFDASIAYLTASARVGTPFARVWRICEWLPFSLKRLRARLRTLDAGTVTVKKRGSPLDTDRLARQLGGEGTRALVVVLTRVDERPAALICEQT